MTSTSSQRVSSEVAAYKIGILSFQRSQEEVRNQGEPSKRKKVCEQLDNALREELKTLVQTEFSQREEFATMHKKIGEANVYMTLRIESMESHQQDLNSAYVSHLLETSKLRRNVKHMRTEANQEVDTLFALMEA